jgi:glucuronoarabinoxylan endo-1,4-beta-xylanase
MPAPLIHARHTLTLLALVCLIATTPAHAATHKPATGTIDPTKLHQEIAGFGASEAFFVGHLARHPHRDEIYDALFGPTNGLHTDFLRLQNRFRYLPRADFDQDAIDVVKAANALRSSPMTIIMSSWSPPAVIKSNHDEKNGGTLITKNGHYDYADFAQYWKDSVTVYRALGVDPTYVSLQNEPDETTDYESCRFNPTEAPVNGESYAGYDKALDAVYKAFQTLPNPPHMLGPETIGIGYGNEQNFEKALNINQLYAVAHHDYTGGDKLKPETYVPAFQAMHDQNRGRLLFQTEYYTGPGFDTALMMHYSLTVEEVNLYLYWPYAWPSTDGGGTLLTVEDPTDPTKWKNPHGWAYTDGYYAMKQFSYFIHAGYHRVESSSTDDNILLSAYLSPKADKLVIVAINTSTTADASIKLKLGTFTAGKSQIYRTTFPNKPEGQSKPDHFANLGPLAPDSTLTLPAHSVATVELTR